VENKATRNPSFLVFDGVLTRKVGNPPLSCQSAGSEPPRSDGQVAPIKLLKRSSGVFDNPARRRPTRRSKEHKGGIDTFQTAINDGFYI